MLLLRPQYYLEENILFAKDLWPADFSSFVRPRFSCQQYYKLYPLSGWMVPIPPPKTPYGGTCLCQQLGYSNDPAQSFTMSTFFCGPKCLVMGPNMDDNKG